MRKALWNRITILCESDKLSKMPRRKTHSYPSCKNEAFWLSRVAPMDTSENSGLYVDGNPRPVIIFHPSSYLNNLIDGLPLTPKTATSLLPNQHDRCTNPSNKGIGSLSYHRRMVQFKGRGADSGER